MTENKDTHVSSMETQKNSTLPEPKYDKPKILLVDMDNKVELALKAEGYTVESGSFGAPYRVKKGDNRVPIIVEANLPNYTEQEIVIIDLVPSKILDEPKGEKHTSEGTKDWWISCSQGIVDPRPRSMVAVQDDFDTILEHGGVFIIFASNRYSQDIQFAHYSTYYRSLIVDSAIDYDNWSFLSVLSTGYLDITPSDGREISVEDLSVPITQFLSRHVKGGEYRCTFKAMRPLESRWVALAHNKYKEAVSVAIVPRKDKNDGWIFIFPQIKSKADFLIQFINEILPDLSPTLFPHLEGARWVHRPEYEIPSVLEFKNRIQEIETETKQKVTELESAIEKEQAASGYLYDLLRQTGDPLVSAVKRALEDLGFKDVADVDKEKEKAGDKIQLREDLQIRDKSPLVLVEVKGINNLPKESYSLQVWKYIAPTMKKLGRTDVRGLSIINHQKNLPALDRENERTFSDDIITNAETQDFGLLTTWDLYRLIRSYIKNGWKHEQIESLFYQNGRIVPIPTHYQYIGMIDHFWENVGVLSIQIEDGEIRKGDRIAFELPIEFEEQDIDSLQIDNHPIELAEAGQRVAIKTHLTRQQARNNVRVYRVDKREN